MNNVVHFEDVPFNPLQTGIYFSLFFVFLSVCVCVCVGGGGGVISNITVRNNGCTDSYSWNFQDWADMGEGTIWNIWDVAYTPWI